MSLNRVVSFFALGIILAVCSCAPVTIDSTPSGASVYDDDGTQIGATPFRTNVIFSTKQFKVGKNNYYDRQVVIGPESPETVSINLQAQPVVLYSKPSAAIINEAGEKIGNTPAKISVTTEPATYTLKLDKYYDQVVNLSVDSAHPTVINMERRPIVKLTATPAGAAVYENGKKIGTAPVEEEILSARTFEIRKDGYFTKTVTLKGAPPYEVNTELEAFPVITVKASVPGAEIVKDGKKAGTGTASFSVGEATKVKVSADRYYPETVTLTPKSDKTVNVTLKAMPYVMIKSVPSGATVKAGGKTLGTTPVEELIERTTTVSVSKDGYKTATQTLTGDKDSVTVTLEKEPEPETTQTVTQTESKPAVKKEKPMEKEEKTEEKAPEKKSFWQKLFGK